MRAALHYFIEVLTLPTIELFLQLDLWISGSILFRQPVLMTVESRYRHRMESALRVCVNALSDFMVMIVLASILHLLLLPTLL